MNSFSNTIIIASLLLSLSACQKDSNTEDPINDEAVSTAPEENQEDGGSGNSSEDGDNNPSTEPEDTPPEDTDPEDTAPEDTPEDTAPEDPPITDPEQDPDTSEPQPPEDSEPEVPESEPETPEDSEPETPEDSEPPQSDDPVAEDDETIDPTDNSSVADNSCFEAGTGLASAGETFSLPNFVDNHSHMNHSDPDKMSEHMAALDLVSYDNATHAAISNGSWCDPAIWHNKTVPGSGANVVIPEGISVTYGFEDDTAINTIRVDGDLAFSTQFNSQLIVDTLVVDPRGTLTIGTKENPVLQNVLVDIQFADNGNINTNWDSQLLSRGLIAHGRTSIHGAEKTVHLKVSQDPKQGDSQIHLSEAPLNWQVGDLIVVAASSYVGWAWDGSRVSYFGTRDDVRTISAINGNIITLDSPLTFDHSTPKNKYKIDVANYSRNIRFSNQAGTQLPVHQRGHFMVMHHNDVDIRYAEFFELGRTDKSFRAVPVESVANVQASTNIQGRYPFHIHRAGNLTRNPAIIVGNAVFGSPGWGYTHHESHADFYNNASYRTHGVGFMAESGNETGTWQGNIAINARGNGQAGNPKNAGENGPGDDVTTNDQGRTGAGFWFRGRLVRSIDNIAVSTNQGYVYLHRGSRAYVHRTDFSLPEVAGYGDEIETKDIPIRGFDGNEAYASWSGLWIVKANPLQHHDMRTNLSDFLAWEVILGAGIEYTSRYTIRDFEIFGKSVNEQFTQPRVGITFGPNTSDMVIVNSHIENFNSGGGNNPGTGIHLVHSRTDNAVVPEGRPIYTIVNPTFINVGQNYQDLRPSIDTIINFEPQTTANFSVNVTPFILPNGANRYSYEPQFQSDEVEYTVGAGWGPGIFFSGEKTDSLGNYKVPDDYDYNYVEHDSITNLVKDEGYYLDSNGKAYAVMERYFSDRLTSETFKQSVKIFLGNGAHEELQNPSQAIWQGAKYQGIIDFNSQAAIANNDEYSTTEDTAITFNMAANDVDPEGDSVYVDGVMQPRNGYVYKNDNDTYTYLPAVGFTGTDAFEYWVTDGNGKFSKGIATINVD